MLPEGGTLVFVKGLGTWLGDDLLMALTLDISPEEASLSPTLK